MVKKINMIKLIPLFITIIVIGLSIGFSAFQNELLVSDIGGIVRVKKDIRVTGLSVSNPTSDAISHWEEYNVNSINSSVTLPNSDSTITYDVVGANDGTLELTKDHTNIATFNNIPVVFGCSLKADLTTQRNWKSTLKNMTAILFE